MTPEQSCDADPWRFAVEATDYEWSFVLGACGGCGDENCHDGPCPVSGRYCRSCPNRNAQGTS